MRIKKATSFRRAATSLLAISFVVPAIAAAGQFDALYSGISASETSNLANWKTFFPGLEDAINQAFTEGKDTQNFILHTNQAPIAWNITEYGNIEINSINVGYFLNKWDYSFHPPKKLFSNLDPESQNVSMTAGNNLIVTPVPVQEGGFGYALSVDNDLKTEISAGNQIVFMTPVSEHGAADYGAFSIVLLDNSFASLRANEIAVFGGVRQTFFSVLDLKGRAGIYFLEPPEGSQGAGSTIDLFASQMNVDAPSVFIDKVVHVGMRMYTETYHSSLSIGQDISSGIQTRNVYFNKAINLEAGSDLRVTSDQAVIFLGPLTLDLNASIHIKSKQIGITRLTLDDTSAPKGATAYFNVTKEGYMYVDEPLSVGNKDALTIDLDENSVLSSVINTHQGGDASINLRSNSFWYSEEDSNIKSLSMAPSSYVQLGPKDKAVEIETENLSGDGGVFYLASNSTGSLKITDNSQGNHSVVLASTGKSLQDSHYIYHIVVDDGSPEGNDKARFKLANNGIIDAGPYQYQLGLGEFRKTDGTDDSRVWVIVGKRSLKPTPPDDVITPPAPDTPKPDLPELPFDPDNPPPFNPSEEQPIGLSPAAKLTLASIASGNQVVQFLGTLDDLRSRMGEIRNGADDGLYFLYRHDKSRYHSNYSSNSRLKYSAFTFGGDYRLNRNWIVGGNLVLTRGKIHVKDAPGNHSRVDSVGAKLYAAWLGEKDQYIDTVLTVNRYSNKLHARSVDESTSNADYHNYGVGLSVEAGKRFYLPFGAKDDSWFIDPQIQLSYFRVSAASFRFSNDMKVHVDSANSLNGRIGFDFGRNFTGADGKNIGQVYLRAGVNHDFLGKTKVRMNEFSFKDHSIGTRVYCGIGGEGAISNKFKVFGQINRESGSRLKTDFQVKFGLKYLF